MAVFWLGTLPVMLGLGVGLVALAGPLRRHVPAVCAVAMIVVGLLAVAGRVRPVDPPAPSHAVATPGLGSHGH
jgi:sulfite exporter TauE/SafE